MNITIERIILLSSLSTLLLAASAPVSASGEDSTAVDGDTTITIDFNLSGGFRYAAGFGEERLTAVYDPYLDGKQEYQPTAALPWWRTNDGTVHDAPSRHGAGWIRIDATVRPVDNAFLHASFVGEMRGTSYGVRNTDNMIVYPLFLAGYDYDLPIADDTLHAGIRLGDFENVRSLNPVTISGIDVQGAIIRLQWRDLELMIEKAGGDLAFGIGLNADEGDHVGIGLRDIPLTRGLVGNFHLSRFSYPQITMNNLGAFVPNGIDPDNPSLSPRGRLLGEMQMKGFGYGMTTSAIWMLSETTKIDGTINLMLRESEGSGRLMSRSAALVEIGGSTKTEDRSLMIKGAYRYYGGLFNVGYRSDGTQYRNPDDEGPTWSNTIGPYLYPLSLIDRPFAIWPVFTEYQDLKDVTGWTFYARGKQCIFDKFFISAIIDVNLVVPENLDPLFYPLLEGGFGYEPTPGFTAELFVTTRRMNLDKHYPTLHALTTPLVGGAMRWNLGL